MYPGRAGWNSLVTARLYVEGGGDSKDLRSRCREGFSKLLQRCSFSGRMPRVVPCGGRAATYDDFKTAHSNARGSDYVAMLVDSEDPVADVEATWRHVAGRDGWPRPHGADDDQVLLMTTCMETWIVSDRRALAAHCHGQLQESALPALVDLEGRSRADVQDAPARASRRCSNAYAKGKRSFEFLSRVGPDTIEPYLPSFARVRRFLNERL